MTTAIAEATAFSTITSAASHEGADANAKIAAKNAG